MKILALTLITNGPDPVTGRTPTPNARLHRVVDNAVLAEELGFDGYAVGERHERPFLSSAPPVVLSHIAARTSRIRCSPASPRSRLLDPVRAYEDYATLDQLSDGRLELIIGKGNGAAQAQLFHVTTEDQWDRNAEGYELFRRLWREERTTWSGRFRPSLVDAETWPPPRQQPIRVWHGSATSTRVGGARRPVRRPAVLGERHQPDRAVRRADRATTASAGRPTATTRRTPWSAPAPPRSTSRRPPSRRSRSSGPIFAAAAGRRAAVRAADRLRDASRTSSNAAPP